MHILSELWKLSAKELFGLAVLGAIVTTVGNLLATTLKEYFFARSFETWKTRRELQAVYRKYRDPLILSLIELLLRMREIIYGQIGDFLDTQLLATDPPNMLENHSGDHYFRRYKLISSIYRLCALLGWLELYRREVTFLDSGHHQTNARFERLVRGMRSALADGQLNLADDWRDWQDSLIFREEQRAIGETMIHADENRVIGYSTFHEQFQLDETQQPNRWIMVAANFLIGFQGANSLRKDFRRARCMLLMDHCISLLECLDSRRLTEDLLRLRDRLAEDIKTFPVTKPQSRSQASSAGR